jgi:hypothetical protein
LPLATLAGCALPWSKPGGIDFPVGSGKLIVATADPTSRGTRTQRTEMKPRILIVADDAAFRATLARWLLSAGYAVELAESAGEPAR